MSVSRRLRIQAKPIVNAATFDSEVLEKTLDWLDRTAQGRQAVLLLVQYSAIRIASHPQPKYVQMAVDEGRAQEDVVQAKMLEHDEQIGVLLKKLKDIGVDDNTIAVYTTDNGNELIWSPTAATLLPR